MNFLEKEKAQLIFVDDNFINNNEILTSLMRLENFNHFNYIMYNIKDLINKKDYYNMYVQPENLKKLKSNKSDQENIIEKIEIDNSVDNSKAFIIEILKNENIVFTVEYDFKDKNFQLLLDEMDDDSRESILELEMNEYVEFESNDYRIKIIRIH